MKKRLLYPFASLLILLFISCEKEQSMPEQTTAAQIQTKAPWTNVLIDEFNAGSNIDARWERTGAWDDNDPQRYDYNSNLCRYRPWNASIQTLDGKSCLRLRSYKLAGQNLWESGHVKSWTSFEPGNNEQIHVQVSAKIIAWENGNPRGFAETHGVWPAIWTVQETQWPTRGEIDMMEAYSYGYYGGEKYASNLFYGYNEGESLLGQNATRHYDDIGEGWHTYDMFWTNVNGNVYVDVQVDGTPVANYHNGIDSDLQLENFGPHNVILNVNIGSNDGIFDNNAINTFWNTDMFVDFVRVKKTTL